MIALREQSRGVFSSFMFCHGLLPVPQLRRGCSGTRHSSFLRRRAGGGGCAEGDLKQNE